MMKSDRKSPSVVIVAAAVLLCATLVTGCFVSGTLARYVSSNSADSDESRAASFSVKAEGNNSSLSFEYGGTASYLITLKNNSEVAVGSTFSIAFAESDITNYLSAKVQGREPAVSGSTLTWTDVCNLSPGQTAQLTLILTGSDNLPGQLSGYSSTGHTYNFSFTPSVTFEQLD